MIHLIRGFAVHRLKNLLDREVAGAAQVTVRAGSGAGWTLRLLREVLGWSVGVGQGPLAEGAGGTGRWYRPCASPWVLVTVTHWTTASVEMANELGCPHMSVDLAAVKKFYLFQGISVPSKREGPWKRRGLSQQLSTFQSRQGSCADCSRGQLLAGGAVSGAGQGETFPGGVQGGLHGPMAELPPTLLTQQAAHCSQRERDGDGWSERRVHPEFLPWC